MRNMSVAEAVLRIGNDDPGTASGGIYTHRNPVTGEPQAEIPLVGKIDVDQVPEPTRFVGPVMRPSDHCCRDRSSHL